MEWYWIVAIIYGVIGIGTGVFHLSLIVGPVTRPLNVFLSIIFWPFYLPILIAAS